MGLRNAFPTRSRANNFQATNCGQQALTGIAEFFASATKAVIAARNGEPLMLDRLEHANEAAVCLAAGTREAFTLTADYWRGIAAFGVVNAVTAYASREYIWDKYLRPAGAGAAQAGYQIFFQSSEGCTRTLTHFVCHSLSAIINMQ
jgi:hypothetical protein